MSNQELRLLIKNELEYIKFKTPGNTLRVKQIYKKYKRIIDNYVIFLSIDITYQEKVYVYVNNIQTNIKCVICYNVVKFNSFSNGYNKTCCVECEVRNYNNKVNFKLRSQRASKTYKNKTGYNNPSKNPLIKEEINNRLNEKFGDIEITFIEYNGADSIVEIFCKKHNIVQTTVRYLLYNKSKCPKCASSSGEYDVEKMLNYNNIKYIKQKTFDGCVYERKLKFDFYLPDYNICIEFDGEQHFEPIDYFNGIDGLEETKKRDNIKNQYCKDNNIGLIRFIYINKKYWPYKRIGNIEISNYNESECSNQFLFWHLLMSQSC